MTITAQAVKTLREKTGAGMMDCKKALVESGGDEEQAIVWLREKGLSKAQKRAGRTTSEGLIGSFISEDNRTGVMVELKCETDFVAKADKFVDFAGALAEQVSETDIEMGTGDFLLDQPYINDGSITVQDQVNDLVAVLGESLNIGRVIRMSVGKESYGVIGMYIHNTGKIGVMVDVRCQSDIKAQDPKIKELAKNVAMQIAAANPVCVSSDELPQELLEKEKAIYKNQAIEEGKPEQIAEKIVEGRVKKYYKEVCLLHQAYIRDDKMDIQGLVKQVSNDLSEIVEVAGFVRIQLGDEQAKES